MELRRLVRTVFITDKSFTDCIPIKQNKSDCDIILIEKSLSVLRPPCSVFNKLGRGKLFFSFDSGLSYLLNELYY